MKVLVLAGGFATRLWPLTESRAKPLLLLNGRSILSYVLYPVVESDGFSEKDIILLTNRRFETDFRAELKQLKMPSINIFCEEAFSEGAKLGALGAISAAIDYYRIQESILVLAGDNILTDFDPLKMRCADDESVLTLRRVKDFYEARKFGVVELDQDGRIIGFEEKPLQPKSRNVSAGFMSFGKNLLSLIQRFSKKSPDALGGIFPELLSKGKIIRPYITDGDWFDVGSFETYLEAHKRLTTQKHKNNQGNTFVGKVYVSEGSSVRNSVLIDTIVYPGTVINDCRISNCIIDENCNLEGLDLNRKLIRKNTTLKY